VAEGADDFIETERKYDAAAGFALPDLAGLDNVAAVTGPRTYRLRAVYFDTPGFSLAKAKITLRRRTGGTDAGWHLKLPAGAEDRREVHAPLGRSTRTVPARLADMVTRWTGGRPLQPIARLATTRRVRWLTGQDGQVLAEIADDLVVGSLPGPARAARLGRRAAGPRGCGAVRRGLQAEPAPRLGRPGQRAVTPERAAFRELSEPVPRSCRHRGGTLQEEQPEGAGTMDANSRDALSAVVARRRGRARLRSATVALGAASLVAAGAVAYTLPGGAAHTTTSTSAAGTAATGSSTVHATSGGSGVATATSSGTGSASAPAAATGTSHATSGGS